MKTGFLSIIIILFGVLSRLVPHTANIVPIGALMLFGGTYLPKKLFWLPILALFLSDYFIGFYGTDMFYVYGSFLLTGLIGVWIKKHKSPKFILGGALFSSVLFFIITNFGVWAPPNNWYPHTFAGLMQSYTMATPFFRNSLIGDLGYTVLLFGGYELIKNVSQQFLSTKLFKIVF